MPGFEVSRRWARLSVVLTALVDANIFYHLENWRGSNTDPFTTIYLSEIRDFQRHITTGAFKIAGGVDLSSASAASSSRLVKQNPIGPAFIQKLTKAFLDTLYAFLDGLVHLASDESTNIVVRQPVEDVNATAKNPLELLDLENAVRHARFRMGY